MRFLDSPPWAYRSKGLEFTGILLTSFVNIDNKWANCSYLNDIEWHWMTKVWKSEIFWWDFLTRLLEQTALRGLNSPASFWFLSFSFVNILKQSKNNLTRFLEWQKSESLKKFWWDFLTCLLEQTALRGLNSPASFWLLSFSFVNIDNKWANCSYLNETSWFDKILMRFLDSPPWTNRSKGLEFTGIF